MTERFYYAGGARIPLELDPSRVAIDMGRAQAKAIAARVAFATRGLPKLPGSLVLAPRAALLEADAHALESSGALQPVYRRGGTNAVPLPEVRIEFDDESARRRVHDALHASNIAVDIVAEDAGRIVVRPSSNRGEDALDLANYVYETAKPAAAAPRFLQIVSRPEPTKR